MLKRSDFTTVSCGFLMGAADIVPGVSGGTVALVLGIYQRLLMAVSQFDGVLLAQVGRRQWRAASERIDLRFLAALAAGVALGILSLARVMHALLEHHRDLTYAAFFGLILASGILVGRMCRPNSTEDLSRCVLLGVAAAALALLIVSQGSVEAWQGHGFTFFSGAIAICAMILPGVSGSYLLIMLGKYEQITGIIKGAPHGQITSEDLLTLAIFAMGCLCGLLVFSKLLKTLLRRAWSSTMALLCGFMIGSLYKIWPFQRGDLPEDASLGERALLQRPYVPEAFDTHVALCAAIAFGCFVAVLAIAAASKHLHARGASSSEP